MLVRVMVDDKQNVRNGKCVKHTRQNKHQTYDSFHDFLSNCYLMCVYIVLRTCHLKHHDSGKLMRQLLKLRLVETAQVDRFTIKPLCQSQL